MSEMKPDSVETEERLLEKEQDVPVEENDKACEDSDKAYEDEKLPDRSVADARSVKGGTVVL